MITPADLGLPAKFAAFRRGQWESISDIAAGDRRFDLISDPTGAGKSVKYITTAMLLGARTCVLTGTKLLQEQLTRDFGAIGLTDIRGQSNYRCVALDHGGQLSAYGHPGTPCADGPCHHGIKCELRQKGCLYYDQRAKAARAQLVVTNYDCWMTNNRYAEPEWLGKFDLLIIDEAHTVPDRLASFCSVELEHAEVKALLDMKLPRLNEGQDSWIEWAQEAVVKCRARYVAVRDEMKLVGTDRRGSAKLLKRLVELGGNLAELAAAHKWRRGEPSHKPVWVPGMHTDWVAEYTKKGALFSPVWAHAYAEDYLFTKIPRIMLFSATLQPSTAAYLGVDKNLFHYREYASTFDPHRRPFIALPTTPVDRHLTEGGMRVLVNKIDNLLDARMDRNGIIHTRSYELQEAIYERSRHRDRMLVHSRFTTRFVVDRFKRARPGSAVLVSPSVTEGYDFPYDECRFQLIAKVPFMDMRSLVLKARARSDKRYTNHQTALALIQMTGRGMRAEDDFCETIVLDSHLTDWWWWAAKKQGHFPKWFLAAFRQEQGLPAAPVIPRRKVV